MSKAQRLAIVVITLAAGTLACILTWQPMRSSAPAAAAPRLSNAPATTLGGPREIGPGLSDEPARVDASAKLEQVLRYRDDPALRQHADALRATVGKDLLATPLPAADVTAAASGIPDDRVWVKLDPFVLETRLPGDTIRLDVPGAGGQGVAGTIDRVSTENGFSRWEGPIHDADPSARFSIAQSLSDRYTIGNFNTADGGFTIEAKNGVGWIRSHAQDAALLTHDDVAPPPDTMPSPSTTPG